MSTTHPAAPAHRRGPVAHRRLLPPAWALYVAGIALVAAA